uniref:Iron-binding zinc finger CDGSH type domain-containing protein n=1 Tax=Timema shepardi TaxID=629360 RepID=A0A7R9G301_TIMSH|nr:unnamed protein product [Timema shepardi]
MLRLGSPPWRAPGMTSQSVDARAAFCAASVGYGWLGREEWSFKVYENKEAVVNFGRTLCLQSVLGTLPPPPRRQVNDGGPLSFPSYSSKAAKVVPEEVMPQNALKDVYSATYQKDNGKIYDKKPFKMRCVPGKNYSWCLCGQSKSQPLCDGTHRNPYLKIKFRPVRFTVTEEKEYWLCNCKQTSNRPFCDGTHKREDIQAAVK